QMMQAHLSKVPQYDSKISMPMQNLLNGMLCKIPNRRISLEAIEIFLKTDTLTKNYAIEPLNEPLTVLDDEHTYRFYAKQNITIALFRYAIELENKDEYEKSKAIYKRLATQNYSRAMNNLGYIYNAGLGEKQDYKKAVYWYTKASKLNNSMAIYNLALMYEHAKGVESNKPYAQKLYALAAKKGYKKAIDHLQSKS
ncbi:MAG: tetratricopeptide repeat protein, partial [Campylobacterota bacterium]|nr:tetratricopeptide repeat protein [Campylobacterota bacterium]